LSRWAACDRINAPPMPPPSPPPRENVNRGNHPPRNSRRETGGSGARAWSPGRIASGSGARFGGVLPPTSVPCPGKREARGGLCPGGKRGGRRHGTPERPRGRVQHTLSLNLNMIMATVEVFQQDSVSEWLRRWTRNSLGSARRGSNPLAVVLVPLAVLQGAKNSAGDVAFGKAANVIVIRLPGPVV
jgi:hypothetical protein